MAPSFIEELLDLSGDLSRGSSDDRVDDQTIQAKPKRIRIAGDIFVPLLIDHSSHTLLGPLQ